MSEEGWRDLLGSGRLLMQEVAAGGSGQADSEDEASRLSRNDQAQLRLSLHVNGEPVYTDKEMSVRIGEEDSVALGMGLALMKVHGRARFKVKNDLERLKGYADDAEIIYDVEVLNKEDGVSVDDMSTDEKLQRASEMRQKGKDAFAANDLHRAMVYYERALTLLGTNREGQELPEDAQLRHACAPLFSNLGIILMKHGDIRTAKERFEAVLRVDANNTKALYWMAKVSLALMDYDEAEKHIKRAFELETQDDKKTFAKLEREIRQARKTSNESNKAMYKKMLDGYSAARAEEEKKSEQITKKQASGFMWRWAVVAIIVGLVAAGLALYLTPQARAA